MALSATARRRWLGGVLIGTAIAMVIAGETVLKGRLGALAFAVYWTVCLLFTGAAVIAALADFRATVHRTIKEQRDLLDSTLKRIEDETTSLRTQQRKNGENGGL
jgi:hypothetical protein